MELDLSGLEPLDTSGLAEADSLDVTGLVPLDTSGLVEDTPAAPGGDPGFISQTARGFEAGVAGGQSMAAALMTIPAFGAFQSLSNEVAAYDAIDAGREPELGMSNLAGRQQAYSAASPEDRTKMREIAQDRIGAMTEVRQGLGEAWQRYSDEASAKSGRVPNFTDIEDAAGFRDWLGFSIGQGAPYIAATTLAAVLGGAPAVAGTGLAIGAGDIQGDLMEAGIEDRGDLALTGAVPYAALEFLGPAGRYLRNVSGATIKEVARKYFQRLGREVPANFVEEFVNEAGQGIISDAVVTSQTGEAMVTDESLLRWFNEGMAGGAAGAPMGAVSAIPGRKADLPPVEITPDDVASPIPTEIIAEGKAAVQEAEAELPADAVPAETIIGEERVAPQAEAAPATVPLEPDLVPQESIPLPEQQAAPDSRIRQDEVPVAPVEAMAPELDVFGLKPLEQTEASPQSGQSGGQIIPSQIPDVQPFENAPKQSGSTRARLTGTPAASSTDDALTFLARRGGIRDDEGHDLKAGRNLQKFVPRSGPLIRPKGMGIDDAGEALWEAGYFGPPDTTPRPTERLVLELLERGKASPVFTAEVQAQRDAEADATEQAEAETRAREEVRSIAEDLGETLSETETREILETMAADSVDAETAVSDYAERLAIQAINELSSQVEDAEYAEIPFEQTGDDRASGEGRGGRARQAGDQGESRESGEDPPIDPGQREQAQEVAPLYANRPVENAADIIAWAKAQGFKTTLPATDMHVTVAYSRDPVDWKAAGEASAQVGSGPGGSRAVEQLGDEGAVVLRFQNLKLKQRWNQYRRAGASWDFPEYKPHITITYDPGDIDLSKVEPYNGPIVLGPERQEALDTDATAKIKEVATGAAPATEQTDQGTQSVIPGAEKITDKQLAERRMEGRKRSTAAQKPADEGLFDVGARKQQDLLKASPPRPPQQEPAVEPVSPGQKIEDFGETLLGARKHYAAAYRERMREAGEADVAAVPLSKSWPEPDYQKLLDAGADPWTVAFIHAARDEVPPKPRKAWRLKGWTQSVELLRDVANQILAGEIAKASVKNKLSDKHLRALTMNLEGRMELYQQVGHEKSLKGIRVAAGSYGIYKGVEYSPAKTIWTVEKAAKATGFSNWPRILGEGDTREAAIADFKNRLNGMDLDPPAKKQVKFSIYSRRGEDGFIIGKKIGKSYIDLRRFDTAKEARAHLAENQAALTAELERRKRIPDHRRGENEPRVGEDHRSGADVSPEQFSEAFGFRGVQFGNYVEGPRRQADLNRAYDALMDLAGVLGVPAKAISLNGKLGLAFGARGHGGRDAAAAHFEADSVVINLTKRDGAGSLAHEWWHAVDNYFSRRRGDNSGFMTERGTYDPAEGVRPEMLAAFRALVASINQTSLRQRSLEIDKRRSKAYWSTGHEMSARAFESYIIAKLQDQGAKNDYLANIVSKEYWDAAEALGVGKGVGEGTESYPYLTPAEIPVVRAEFDNFFNTVETRETERGVEMFSRRRETISTGPDGRTNRFENDLAFWRGGVERLRRGEGAAMRLGDQFHVLRHMGVASKGLSLSPRAARQIDQTHPDLPATVWRNLPELISDPLFVYPFSGETVNVAIDARTTRGEPIVVGIRDGAIRTITPFHNSAQRAGQDRVHDHLVGAIRAGKNVYVREAKAPTTVLQALREKTPARGRAKSGVGGRPSVGTKGKIVTRDDVIKGQGRVFYSLDRQTSGPAFFSGLIRSIEGLKQPKAPALQWRGIINGLKNKGVKQEEIDWSGVLDWLAARKSASVTQTELLDFLRDNRVQVEEVTKSAADSEFETAEEAIRFLASIEGSSPDQVREGYGYVDDADYISLANSMRNGEAGTTLFSEYVLPGGENYRELLLRLPDGPASRHEVRPSETAAAPFMATWDRLNAEIRKAREEQDQVRVDALETERDAVHQQMVDATIEESGGLREPFTGGHFEEPNVLAHVRFNERSDADGNRVLFIEEIQSDWHQAGRKKGYLSALDVAERARLKEIEARLTEIRDMPADVVGTEEQDLWREEQALRDRTLGGGVPDAPFKGSWHELAFKRMLRWAAESGFDRVAWTTGKQQAERYDLSKHVDAIRAAPASGRRGRGYHIWVRRKGGTTFEALSPPVTFVREEKLADTVGKELAETIKKRIAAGEFTVDIEGQDLKIGGEGMKGFYDKILPNFANKYGKKWGARVGETQVRGGETSYQIEQDSQGTWVAYNSSDQYDYREFSSKAEAEAFASPETLTVWSLPITDAMRESVLQGQPLFSRPREDVKALETDLRARLKDVGISDRVAVKAVKVIRSVVTGKATPAQGRYIRGLIEVAIDSDQSWVLNHEIIHGLRDMGLFKPAEWRTLEKAARADKARMAEIRERYEDLNLTDAELAEEAIADMFADWVAGRSQVRGFLRSAFERLRAFLEALGNALSGSGFRSAGAVFGDVDRGEVGAREAADQDTAGERFSLAPEERDTAENRDRAAQGFFARGQPLDRALRIPFDWFGGVNEQGEWKPGAKLFSKAESALTSAKFSDTSAFAWMNGPLQAARVGLIDRYGLDPAYVKRERALDLDKRAIAQKGVDFLNHLKGENIGPAEAKVLQAVLTGEEVADADMSKIAAPIRQAIDELGAEAVSLGLISAESFERNRGSYLHRVYMKNEADQPTLSRWFSNFMAGRRKKIQGDAFKGRGLFMDVTIDRAMRDSADFAEGRRGRPVKGESFIVLDKVPDQAALALEDGSAAAQVPAVERRVYWPEGKAVPARYRGYTNRGAWEVRRVMGDKVTLWRDFTKVERETMGEIMDARYTIGKTFSLLGNDIATGRFYADIAKNNDWARTAEPGGKWVNAGEFRRLWNDQTVEWVKVPDVDIPKTGGKKRWGALAGMYVRAEIWRDLNEIDIMSRPNLWTQLLTQWKLNKTARSPVVHMNNIMSNLVFMDLADVRAQDLVAGIRAFVKETADYREAEEHGAFGADLITQEIRRNILQPILDDLQKEAAGGGNPATSKFGLMGRMAESIWDVAKAADRKMVDLYRLEDEIFRMALYMRRRSLGDSPENAAAEARSQFLDYDIRAPWVNTARRTVLPFISYTYRAVPVIARSIKTRPWKLAKYFLLAQAASYLAYMIEPGDEDEERRSLRDTERGYTWIGVPRMLRMPYRDAYGNPVFLDIRRWIPAGDVFDLSQGHGAFSIPAPLQFGGPLMLGAELALNKSAFTGEEITNDLTDTTADKAGKIADWAWKSWMPSAAWIPGSWYWKKIGLAVDGATDSQGRPYPIPEAVASSFGVKLKPQDVDENFRWRAYEFDLQRRALNQERKRLQRLHQRGIVSDSAFEEGMDAVDAKLDRVNERAAEILP